MSQNKVFLALGSNVGNRKVNFNSCLMELKKISKLKAIANIYVSKPYGYKKQNDFYNTVVEVKTHNNPFQLMNQIKIIEKKLHKNKILINGPRRIDIDIIFFNSLNISYKKLIIPHPRMHQRSFVLQPLCELNPKWIHPITKKGIKELIRNLNNKQKILKISKK